MTEICSPSNQRPIPVGKAAEKLNQKISVTEDRAQTRHSRCSDRFISVRKI